MEPDSFCSTLALCLCHSIVWTMKTDQQWQMDDCALWQSTGLHGMLMLSNVLVQSHSPHSMCPGEVFNLDTGRAFFLICDSYKYSSSERGKCMSRAYL